MKVEAKEFKKNTDKYLEMVSDEDIVILENGMPLAVMRRLKPGYDQPDSEIISETSAAYDYKNEGQKMSYEEFIEMYENTEDRYEYIDGIAYLLASPRTTHQRILGNLYLLFRLWFKGKKCVSYLSPFDVTLKKSEQNINVVQPDLLVVCDDESKNEKDKYTGIPTLVVEILSISTSRMELVRKLNLYMQTGVSEYWIINYIKKEVLIYLFKDGDIADTGVFVKNDTASSFVFEGLTAKLEEIFA